VTVLVDDAVWAWRGERWAHLTSDRSLVELHRFAELLGVRRLAFQGDHYDVPAPIRARAVDLGAVTVTSRELVRRLRLAGLRRRGAARPEPWRRIPVPHGDRSAAAFDGLLVRELGRDAAARFAPILAALPVDSPDARVTVFGRTTEAALAIELPGAHPCSVPSVDIARAGTVHVTAQGSTTLVEILVDR
jgi:hypothetical protein